MTSTENQYLSASLYIGDLAPEVNEAVLFDLFNAVGPVASIRVCRDAATRMSLGYAYVNFHNVQDAERALETMNYSTILGKVCRIMWSQRDPSLRRSGVGNIFVKNLDKSIDHRALFDTFGVFGNILSCKVSTGEDGESLGYGFVHYETDEAAKNAIDNVDGMMIQGKIVHVAPFVPRAQRGGAGSTLFTNVYAKNFPTSYSDEQLSALFGRFGEITSLVIVKDPEGVSRGFGFVNFETPEAAMAAVQELNGYEFDDGKKLYVSRAQKKSERRKQLVDEFERKKQERQSKWVGCNLYVKNLADNVDDAILREAFAPYGNVTSARVMTDPQTGRTKGFGFVCYETREEAAAALQEMSQKILEGKPLYVNLAQKKDARRAELEHIYANRVAKLGGVGAVPAPYLQAPVYFAPPAGGMPNRANYVYPGAPQVARRYPAAPGAVPTRVIPANAMYPVNGANRAARGARGPRGRPFAGANPRGPARRDQPNAPVPAALSGKLALHDLANAPPEKQKQLIGERLFPLIRRLNANRAGKITGMLLEMDNSDLLELLESPEALEGKVREAVQVLDEHLASRQAE